MLENKFMCINYPANVTNPDNAIKTLGGLSRIQQAFATRHGKLFLNFNPDNIFTKALCSDQQDNDDEKATNSLESFKNDPKSTCFIMKVTKLKDKDGRDTYKDSKIIGKVDKMLTFSKMVDFQYFPMERINAGSQNEQYKDFYEQFNFNEINNYKKDLKADIPLYVLPPFFSRFDDPANYAFRPEPTKKNTIPQFDDHDKPKSSKSEENDNLNDSQASTNEKHSEIDTELDEDEQNSSLIHSVRQERSSLALLITFDNPTIPQSIKNCNLK